MSNQNKLEEILKEINKKKVQLENIAVTKNTETLTEVLEAVKTEFKEDELFNALFKKIQYGGSYYEGLKVSKPDEYDINFVLKMPELATCVITTKEAGHVQIHIEMEQIYRHDYLRKYIGLSKLLDNNGFLSVQKTNNWFQGLLYKAMPNLEKKFDIHIFKYSSSGPARTIIVDNSFAVDLVPAFWMLEELWPNYYNKSNLKEDFFIIPKPIENEPLFWRCSFYEHERKILHGLESVKGAIRLLKVLRDEQNHLNQLKSYFIKTVFLWEIPKDYDRYKRMSLSAIFMEMLEKLETYIRVYNIPFYWNKSLNLLKENEDLWKNMANSLNSIRFHINRDPNEAYVYFKVDAVDQLSDNFDDATISDDEYDEGGGTMTQEPGMSLAQKIALGGTVTAGVLALAGILFSSSNSRRNQN